MSPQTHLEIVLLKISGFITTGVAGRYRFKRTNVETRLWLWCPAWQLPRLAVMPPPSAAAAAREIDASWDFRSEGISFITGIMRIYFWAATQNDQMYTRL